jgi:hypothetical protein
MPQNRDAYTRYRMIDVRLRKKPYPHLEELIEYVKQVKDFEKYKSMEFKYKD